jgi:hypothetical protein
MNEIDHFKFFAFYSGDVTGDVDNLHCQENSLSGFLLYSYEEFAFFTINDRYMVIISSCPRGKKMHKQKLKVPGLEHTGRN